MNTPLNAAQELDRNASRCASAPSLRKKEPAHVLLVAPMQYRRSLNETIVAASNQRLCAVAHYHELWAMPALEPLPLAILSDAIPSFELEASCRLIRRRWRNARILILQSRTCSLDEALYDGRIAAAAAPEALGAAIRRLIGKRYNRR